MKKIILVLILLLMSGCADKRIVLVPQSEYYPTFDASDFDVSEKYHIEMWAETEETNGTKIDYLVTEKQAMLGFIQDTKELRFHYNTLLKELQIFNKKIQKMNKIQNSKKPQEVQEIKDSWFK